MTNNLQHVQYNTRGLENSGMEMSYRYLQWRTGGDITDTEEYPIVFSLFQSVA